jgi:membrane-associated PAP2 superfamily phosphatase
MGCGPSGQAPSGFLVFFLFFLIILERFSYFVFTDSLEFFPPGFFGIAIRFSNFQNLKLFNFKIV